MTSVPEPAAWDTMHNPGPPELHWSTDNVGEAAPGVLTPLTGSVWETVGDTMTRSVAQQMGVFTRAERDDPSAAGPVVRRFYGRLALQIECIGTIGDRVPGSTGAVAVEGLLGKVPVGMTFTPTRARYPAIAARLPVALVTSPARVRALARETDAWWRAEVPRLATLERQAAVAKFVEARERFHHNVLVHSLSLLSALRPFHEALDALVARAGVGDVGVLSGTGGAEMAIISDIWEASRGRLTLDDVVANHGFHGPLEGELASRVWREDPEPLRRMIAGYAERPESEDPRRHEADQRRRAAEQRARLLAALPPAQRPGARVVLRLAAARLPQRGVGKRAFLQGFDIARGAARRAGECLADDGVLADADDVFYLTDAELTGRLEAGGARDLVTQRRERRAAYEALALPGSWKGTPAVTPVREIAGVQAQAGDVVEGIGVSAGVVEGVVRVVTDPAFAEVEPDEILVTPTTDPSWSSIMFISAGLVVDIGGALSHAAVVARELGLPCVVNTRVGTQVLRTGDRVRLDGSSGEVLVLECATAIAPGRTA